MDSQQIPGLTLNTDRNAQVINIKDILLKYLHYWWLFILLLALGITAAWLYLRYTKPTYSVSATLLIRNDNLNMGGGGKEDMFADIALFQSNTNKQNEMEILRSRTMMERVVKALDLQEAYFVQGNVKTTNIYRESPFDMEILHLKDSVSSFEFQLHFTRKRTFTIGEGTTEYSYDEEIILPQGKFRFVPRESAYTNLPFTEYIVRWMPVPDAAEMYGDALDVKAPDDLSSVLQLVYVTENPRLGADILNRLMEEYNEAAIEDKNEINRRIIAFIDDRLHLVESQLDSVERNLQIFKTKNQVIDLESQSKLYFGNIGDLQKNITEQEIQLQVTGLLENYLRDPKNRLNLVPSTLGLQDPTLLELVSGYNKLVMEREHQLQTGATPGNPVVVNIESDMEKARQKMLRNLSNIREAYRNALNSLNSQSGALNKQIASIPEKERETREKARQQEIKQNLYLYLLQKKEESSIAKASTIAGSRVVDNARSNQKQMTPVPLRIYGIAAIAGLLLPVILIYIMDLLNDKVTTRSDILKATKAPIIAEIGHSVENQILLFPERSRTVVAEQFRILRSNLRFILNEFSDKPTVMVTSSVSGEGKSFVSTNLGASLALSGKRTVILEFDLRKPKITAGLGLSKGHGITNYLVGGATLAELPHEVPDVENLFVIPCGPVPPNPSEILLTPRIAELFHWLKREFDAIVIDTAPVGLVSDAMTLSVYADATLYLVRQRYTYKKQIQFIDELYGQKKLPRLGLIVNDVVAEGSKGYYGYGAGRYGYGYGYGFGNRDGYYEQPKQGIWKRMSSNFKG